MKLNEFVFKRVPRDVREFADEVTVILNNGKYSAQVVGTPPTWQARNGEFLFMTSSTTRRVYFYVNNAWHYLEFVVSGTGTSVIIGGGPAGNDTEVQYNSGGVFGASPNFIFDVTSSRTVTRTSAFINTATNGMENRTPALLIAGRVDSTGGVVVMAKTSGSINNLFEIQDGGRTVFGDQFKVTVPMIESQVVIDGGGGQAILRLDGRQQVSNPDSIIFSNHHNFNGARVPKDIASVGIVMGTVVNDVSGGWLQLTPYNLSNINSENPSVEISNCVRTITSDFTNQRFLFIRSNNLNSGGGARTVSNCTTAFIEGPTVAGANVTISNNYALWVNKGVSRFDGNVIIKGGTISVQDGVNILVGPTVFYTSTAIGVVSNDAVERSLIGPGSGTLMTSGNYIGVGKTMRVSAAGYYSTQVVPVTLNLRLRVGGTAGTIVVQTGDQTPIGSMANRAWKINALLTCQTTGATGTMQGHSAFEHMATVGATGSPTWWEMTSTSTVAINTTTDNEIQLTADWGAGVAAGDQIFCTNFVLEALN